MPVVNSVCCFIANYCRSQRTRDGRLPDATLSPPVVVVAPAAHSFRLRFYACTEGSARLVRVMFSHIDVVLVIQHLFAALSNLWVTGVWWHSCCVCCKGEDGHVSLPKQRRVSFPLCLRPPPPSHVAEMFGQFNLTARRCTPDNAKKRTPLQHPQPVCYV